MDVSPTGETIPGRMSLCAQERLRERESERERFMIDFFWFWDGG